MPTGFVKDPDGIWVGVRSERKAKTGRGRFAAASSSAAATARSPKAAAPRSERQEI